MKYDYVIIRKSSKGAKKTIEKIPSSYAYWDKVRQNDEKKQLSS